MQAIKDASDVKVFQCPSCQNYINNMTNNCKYCSAEISDNLMSTAVGKEDFITNAYNAATNLRNSAASLIVLFGLSFVPFVSLVAGWMHLGLLITIPIGLVYWLFKYGTTKLDDPNFNEAKKKCWIAFAIWVGFVVLRVVLLVMFFSMIGRRY